MFDINSSYCGAKQCVCEFCNNCLTEESFHFKAQSHTANSTDTLQFQLN